MVERFGLVDVADVEMHVTEDSSGRHSSPWLTAGRSHKVVDIEMVGGHVQLSLVVAPRVAWPVGVDFDAQAVGIREIDRLTHEVVGHSCMSPDLRQVRNE